MNSISDKSKISKSVKLGSFITIHDNVTIGDHSVIDSYSELGVSNGREKGPLIIGAHAKIRSHSVIYAGNTIGENFTSAHFSVIRENNTIGNDFQIGTSSLVQPDCQIGNYVRIISHSMITHNSTIGNFVWIFPFVKFTSDPHPPSSVELKGPIVNDFAVIAAGAVILPGIVVGSGSIVAAGCVLTKNLPSDMVATGVPGKVVGHVSQIKLENSDISAYPWRNHFQRGYPADITKDWHLDNIENNT